MVAARNQIESAQETVSPKSLDELVLELGKLAAVVDCQDDPKKADTDALHSFIREHPEVLSGIPSLIAQTLAHIMKQAGYGAGSQLIRAAQLGKLRTKLGYDEATELERLLIDRAVMCWLRLNLAEVSYSASVIGGTTIREAEFRDKVVTRAHKRFESACETLARVRGLKQPRERSKGRAGLALLRPVEGGEP
jgi:hypothetical protein